MKLTPVNLVCAFEAIFQLSVASQRQGSWKVLRSRGRMLICVQ